MKKINVIVKKSGNTHNTYTAVRPVRTNNKPYLTNVIDKMAKEYNTSTAAFRVFDMVTGEEYPIGLGTL